MTLALEHAPGFGDVGACLRDARISSGVSVRDLATRSSLCWHTIYMYEKGSDRKRRALMSAPTRSQEGTRGPNVRTLEEVAAALDVDLVFTGGRWNWVVK